MVDFFTEIFSARGLSGVGFNVVNSTINAWHLTKRILFLKYKFVNWLLLNSCE